jgi:hypothetical protein
VLAASTGGASDSLADRITAEAPLPIGDQLAGQLGVQVLHGVLLSSLVYAIGVREQCDVGARPTPVT